MRIAMLKSSGTDPLIIEDQLRYGFNCMGFETVQFLPCMPKNHFDLLLVFNQVQHDPAYCYVNLPDYDVKMAFIDTAEYGYFCNRAGMGELYSNAFSISAITHPSKNMDEQIKLKKFLSGRSFPYFLREMNIANRYPENYHPIDYPLHRHSLANLVPNYEHYINRHLDFSLIWGMNHPWRRNITAAMRKYVEALPCPHEIYVIAENGQPRMPQQQYYSKLQNSRCGISFDGYGTSSWRLAETLVRCTLLQGPLNIVRYKPLVDGETCVMFDIESDGTEFLSTNITEKFKEIQGDLRRSYDIYNNGFYHCMENYTEVAAAQYVLNTIERHDWSVPTKLDL